MHHAKVPLQQFAFHSHLSFVSAIAISKMLSIKTVWTFLWQRIETVWLMLCWQHRMEVCTESWEWWMPWEPTLLQKGSPYVAYCSSASSSCLPRRIFWRDCNLKAQKRFVRLHWILQTACRRMYQQQLETKLDASNIAGGNYSEGDHCSSHWNVIYVQCTVLFVGKASLIAGPLECMHMPVLTHNRACTHTQMCGSSLWQIRWSPVVFTKCFSIQRHFVHTV